MREIKYRAWGVVSQKMYDWNSILSDKFMLSAFGLPVAQCRLIWLQFIGLKDTNGKEIYEGDIVLMVDDGGNGDLLPTKYNEEKDEYEPCGLFEVRWDSECCRFDLWDIKDKCLFESDYCYWPDAKFEIKGNIYEDKK